MKIAFIVGARPQFIKLSPLVQAAEGRKLRHVIIHTGQHYDQNMSPVFFRELNLPQPNYNLKLGMQKEVEQLGTMIIKISETLEKEKIGLVVVIGDTTSTLAGALAAAKMRIDLAHVEAGMRSYTDMPEEENRVLTDHVSKYLFCSTKEAVDNLKKENINKNVFLAGDLLYDNLLQMLKSDKSGGILEELGLQPKEYFLLTAHRAENTDSFKNLNNILTACSALKKPCVFPIHPRTKKTIADNNKNYTDYDNIKFLDPVGYKDMLNLLKNADKVLTDSGGLQKEAYLLGIPCITLRHETEWNELIKAKWNILVGSDKTKIKNAAAKFKPSGKRPNFYGTGHAAEKIVEVLAKAAK